MLFQAEEKFQEEIYRRREEVVILKGLKCNAFENFISKGCNCQVSK